jgi:hypothetical protein
MKALMMDAVNTSETLVNFYEITWRNIPENGHISHLNMQMLIFWLVTPCV